MKLIRYNHPDRSGHLNLDNVETVAVEGQVVVFTLVSGTKIEVPLDLNGHLERWIKSLRDLPPAED